MNYKKLFKQYNLKLCKRNLIIMLLMSLSILVTSAVSFVIPQISYKQQQNVEANTKIMNGADLKIVTSYQSSKFDDKIKDIESNGAEIKKYDTSVLYIINGNNSIVSEAIMGDYDLDDNEVILSQSIAESLNLDVGDTIKFDKSADLDEEYRIKEIDQYNSGVNSQGELIGYVKMKPSDKIIISNEKIILIDGIEGDKVKEELKDIEDGYEYTALTDQEQEAKDKINVQLMSLNILNTMGYILTVALIVSTILLTLNKCKRDIAILRMLSIDYKCIKKAMILQFMLFIMIPVIIAGIISPFITNILLKYQNITFGAIVDAHIIQGIIEGMIFNVVSLFIIISISLRVIQGIKPLDIVRTADTESREDKTKLFVEIALAIPIILFLYSVVYANGKIFTSSVFIFVFLLIVFVITLIMVKLVTMIPSRINNVKYTLKSIKKTQLLYIVVVINTVILLVCVLIGFKLGDILKNSINKGIDTVLPYNYMIKSNSSDNKYIDGYIQDNNDMLSGYDCVYKYSGKAIDNDIKQRAISMVEIKKTDKNLKFNIIDGEDLNKDNVNEVIVSNKYCDNNNLKVGDKLNILSENGESEYLIRGIYDCSSVNQNWVLKYANQDISSNLYILKIDDDSFINNIENCSIGNMNIVGDAIYYQMENFLMIFKYLCFLYMISGLVFSINMTYVYYKNEERNYTIMRAIGKGKQFAVRDQILKSVLNIVLSTLISVGIYSLIIKFALIMMFNINFDVDLALLLFTFIISVIFNFMSLCIILRRITSKVDFDILREDV